MSRRLFAPGAVERRLMRLRISVLAMFGYRIAVTSLSFCRRTTALGLEIRPETLITAEAGQPGRLRKPKRLTVKRQRPFWSESPGFTPAEVRMFLATLATTCNRKLRP